MGPTKADVFLVAQTGLEKVEVSSPRLKEWNPNFKIPKNEHKSADYLRCAFNLRAFEL